MANLYKIFHDHVKNSRIDTGTPSDPKDWPEDWKTIFFKSYPRFPRVKLISPKPINTKLSKLLINRHSSRNFSVRPLSLGEISQLLIYGAGIKEKIKKTKITDWNSTSRTYASGGARYPIELYAAVLSPAKKIAAGIYHFNFKEHSLERLLSGNPDEVRAIVGNVLTYPWGASGALVIFMSAVFERSARKYKDFAYRLFWAECGHIGQNLYLVSEALGLKCCAMAGIREDKVNTLLDLDGENESTLMAYEIGK